MSAMPPRRSPPGKCKVALITLAGRPRAEGMATGTVPAQPWRYRRPDEAVPEFPTADRGEHVRHVRHAPHARVRHHLRAAGLDQGRRLHHAQHNPHALLRDVVTVEEVVNSPIISDPLHRLDCCVITDGGGAMVVVAPEIAASRNGPRSS